MDSEIEYPGKFFCSLGLQPLFNKLVATVNHGGLIESIVQLPKGKENFRLP